VCEFGLIGVDYVTKSFNGLYENKSMYKRFVPVYNSSASPQVARWFAPDVSDGPSMGRMDCADLGFGPSVPALLFRWSEVGAESESQQHPGWR
jgi:hypothetical protein